MDHKEWPDVLGIGDRVQVVDAVGDSHWWTCVGWNGHAGDLDHLGIVTQAILVLIADGASYWCSVAGMRSVRRPSLWICRHTRIAVSTWTAMEIRE